jgi:hypothetical protein
MPKDIIDCVHKMARRSYVAKDLVFQLRDGDPVDEDDESAADPDYEPGIADDEDDDIFEDKHHDEDESHVSDDNVNEDNDIMAQLDGLEEDGLMQNDNDEPGGNGDEVPDTDNQSAKETDTEVTDRNDELAGVPELEQDETIDEDGEFAGVPGPADMQVINDDDVNQQADQEADELDQRYGKREHGYSLRPRKPRSYKHRHADLEDVIMTQLSLKKGLVAYGEEGARAVTSELKQLHDKSVMTPRAANLLT